MELVQDKERNHYLCKSQIQDHCVRICSQMYNFSLASKYTDVNILCQDQVFRCHRAVLASASEYFDKMFSGSFRETHLNDIELHDIDSATFEEVVAFSYKGDVPINDDNVYSLLRAADILSMRSLENECIRYLTECNIPVEYALDLFLLACLTGKNSLIPVLSQLILDHLEYFSRTKKFLEIPFEELNTLLSYFQLLCSKEENMLLNAIFHWVSHSTRPVDDRKHSFVKLTQNIEFQYISREYIEEFIEKNSLDFHKNGSVDNNLPVPDLNVVDKSTIHVFIERRSGPSSFNITDRTLNAFTLKKSTNVIDWYPSQPIKYSVCKMEIAAIENQLYSLVHLKENSQYKLMVFSSADLSTVKYMLKVPFEDEPHNRRYCISHNTNNIYVNGLGNNSHIYAYNCELDKWFTIIVNGIFEGDGIGEATMVCDNRRIYLLGMISDENIHGAQAYDQRSGKWEKLQDSNRWHSISRPSCLHKGKIYCCNDDEYSNALEVYDVVAGKWNDLDEKFSDYEYKRLLSYNNKLWTICRLRDDYDSSLLVKTYDTFLQEWAFSSNLDDCIQKTYPAHNLHREETVMSAVVFEAY